ncbi:hypothetical protein HK414_03235 [Ramlibacter terrae]|uniref:Uncharacterized protein n=1 Tax=Ramlibacter terrae TaxID=2732511 RepID=A0ABX6P0E5_9BURK|nr:hypothetical protein HK414_03235 [Ramlibacter terrae]
MVIAPALAVATRHCELSVTLTVTLLLAVTCAETAPTQARMAAAKPALRTEFSFMNDAPEVEINPKGLGKLLTRDPNVADAVTVCNPQS